MGAGGVVALLETAGVVEAEGEEAEGEEAEAEGEEVVEEEGEEVVEEEEEEGEQSLRPGGSPTKPVLKRLLISSPTMT